MQGRADGREREREKSECVCACVRVHKCHRGSTKSESRFNCAAALSPLRSREYLFECVCGCACATSMTGTDTRVFCILGWVSVVNEPPMIHGGFLKNYHGALFQKRCIKELS